ncbi:MAG TPA: TonB family protein [Candidatus Binatia bacterium]|nr:TonB family protein [Candidatus Binatia bacterium]
MSAVRNTLFPFLLVSTVLHLLLMFSWYGRALRPPAIEQIPITIFAAPEKAPAPPAAEKAAPPRSAAPPPTKAPREIVRNEKTTRAELPPGQPAKIDRPGAEAPPKKITKSEKPIAKKPPVEEEETNSPRVETAENGREVIQAMPTLEELLPPGMRLANKNGVEEQAPIRLDSRDPRFSDYLKRVKHALDLAWADPTIARSAVRSFGIDGKLVVRFTQTDSGELDELYITRTSGYDMLDQEALRVVAAAAPNFGRAPRSFGKRPIDVTFIYEKNTVSFSFVPR